MSARPALLDEVPVARVQPDGPETLLVEAVEITATRSVPDVDELRVGETLLVVDVVSGPVCLSEIAAPADDTPTVSASAASGQTTRQRRSVRRAFRLATIDAPWRRGARRRRGERPARRQARAGESSRSRRNSSPAAAG